MPSGDQVNDSKNLSGSKKRQRSIQETSSQQSFTQLKLSKQEREILQEVIRRSGISVIPHVRNGTGKFPKLLEEYNKLAKREGFVVIVVSVIFFVFPRNFLTAFKLCQ